MNWVDILIIALIALAAIDGVQVGIIAVGFEIVALIFGFLFSSKYFHFGSELIRRHVSLNQNWADVLSFVLIFLIIRQIVLMVGDFLNPSIKQPILRWINKISGGLIGLVMGVVITGIILTLLAAFPLNTDLNKAINESKFGPQLVAKMSVLYEKADFLIPTNIPRLAFFPEQLKEVFEPKEIDFSKLDGATCIKCGGKIKFLGYLTNKYKTISPKFVCEKCGRTSDGCQTYEGHHLMYGECPAVLGKQGYRFDCGIWTNSEFVKPKGTCLVCGEKAEILKVKMPLLISSTH